MTELGHPTGDPPDDPNEVAERIAAVVGAVPGVAALHRGTYGDIVSYLPGRRLVGVRVGRPDEPVEIGLVLGLSRPVPAVVADVRRAVATVCDRPVDITVADVTDAVPRGAR
ncbi:MAG: hypothetical protein L0H84_12955 [Pseudonocardia sp.]|nr:hypothetical protein [Pseudonocardia sp.]